MKIDHIGYLVSDINKSIQVFQRLGYNRETEIFTDNVSDGDNGARNVYICFLRNGRTRIELVSPANEESDVSSILKRQGEGPYHICYRVENIDKTLRTFTGGGTGWLVIKKPTKAIALHNARVAFLFKNGVGMLELVETMGESR